MRFDIHPFANVEAARLWARAEIDAAAGLARLRFTTDLPGQQEAYAAKYQEACGYIASNYVVGYAMPWIEAEAKYSGSTLRAAADLIKQRGDRWVQILGPSIEGIRIAGKSSLACVQTIAEVVGAARAVIAQFDLIE